MKQPEKHSDPFEKALRSGPRPVKLPTGFHQRMENSWRRAPQEEIAPSVWEGVVSVLRLINGPLVAAATIALIVVWVQTNPGSVPVPVEIPVTAPVATVNQERPVVDDSTLPMLASFEASLNEPYSEEARLMLDDATRALRFAAEQVLTDDLRALAERSGIPLDGLLARRDA